MIVVGGKSDNVCIIHAIAGPESAVELDLHGHTSVDITELVRACQGRRVVLKLTRSLCEADTVKALSRHGIATTETAAPLRQQPQQQFPAMPPAAPDTEALLRRPAPNEGVCRICGAIGKTVDGVCAGCGVKYEEA